MSTIEQVRAAEKRVKAALEALHKAPADCTPSLADELAKATDQYARLVRELTAKYAIVPVREKSPVCQLLTL